jgi:arylformamidase
MFVILTIITYDLEKSCEKEQSKAMFAKLIDISQLVQAGMPVYPGDTPYTTRPQLAIANGAVCNLADFTMSMHGGTHVDAPLHFIKDGPAIPDLELERFCGKARVIELDVKAPVDVDDLAGLAITGGERILIKIPANEALTDTMVFNPNFIGLTAAAAAYLVARNVALVGINCCSIENESGNEFPVHRKLLAAGIPIVENLRLAAVAVGEYHLTCFPLKLAGGNGAPARAILASLTR